MSTVPSSRKHWASQQERGNRLVLTLTRLLAQYCPIWLLRPIAMLIGGYYYISSPAARQYIGLYQHYLQQTFPALQPLLSKKYSVLKQFYTFAMAIVDRFKVWQGKILYADLVVHDPDNLYQHLDQSMHQTAGQILLCSHLGNIEICRALAQRHPGLVLNVLIHSAHAVKFNQALAKAGASSIRLIQVTQLDIVTMMQLNQRVQQGEWLAIAADRVPVCGEKRLAVEFLGHAAYWPQGPWLLAGLLQVPVNTLFCLKQNQHYHLYLNRFAERITWQHQQREQTITHYARQYAAVLEKQCQRAPWQWFNFYSFWNQYANK